MAASKICPLCGEEKPLTTEYWHRKGTGFQVYCKPCKRKINLDRYYEGSPVEVIEGGERTCPKCKVTKPLTKEFWTTNRRGWQSHCKSCANSWHTNYRKGVREIVLEVYSDGPPECACCGESELDFLVIDHISGGGGQHKKSLKGTHIYHWLMTHDCPEGFRVLCHNCNWAFHKKGYCPHNPPTE